MRIVMDTNTIVSAVLSPHGPPRRLLDLARSGAVQLYTSPMLLAEFVDVVGREKFASYWTRSGLTPLSIVIEIRRLCTMAVPESVPTVVLADADDDHVLACAVAGSVDLIVSGDKHLLGLGGAYHGIRIVTPAVAELVLRA